MINISHMVNNFRMFYKEDTKEALNLIKGKTTYQIQKFTLTHYPKKPRWPIGDDLLKVIPSKDIEWYGIERSGGLHYDDNDNPNSTYYHVKGALIKTKKGNFFIFRNGNNISSGNFGLMDLNKEKIHYRHNKKMILNLLKILTADRNDIPLIVTKDLCVKNKEIVLKMISKGVI